MKRGRRVVVGIAACVAVATVAALVWPKEREPVYQGKKLSEWLTLYENSHHSPEAVSAVRHIGTNAVPFLVHWMSYTTPAWRVKAFNLCSRLRWQRGMVLLWRGATPGEGRGELAPSGFAILGEEATPAVPELVRIMNRRRPDPSRRAIEALRYVGRDGLLPLFATATNGVIDLELRRAALTSIGNMRYLGSNAMPAVPILVRCLEDPALAERAAKSLGWLTLDSEHAVPALVVCLGRYKRESEVRLAALEALAQFRDPARPAVPALLSMVNDPVEDLLMRRAAAFALKDIAPEVWNNLEHKERLYPQ